MNPINNLERLLIMMTFSKLDRNEISEAKNLAEGITDWNSFWELSYTNRVAPLVQWNLEKIKVFKKLPEEIRNKFNSRSEQIEGSNEARLKVGRKFLKKFSQKKIPVIILKGINFAETLYRNPYYRRMNDIDILIKREDLDGIFEVYKEMDFFSASELLGGDPRKQESYSHHLPSFFSRDLTCVVGTHWGLITPLAPFTIDYDAIWSRAVSFDFYSIPVLSMSPEDNLHHLCVHLPFYKSGLKELADIYNIVRHYGSDIDWGIFLGEVKKAKSEKTVYHAFSVCNRIYPLKIFEDIIAKVEGNCSYFFKKDVQKKIRHMDVLLSCRSVHQARMEKAFNELNWTNKPGETWKFLLIIWKNLLFTPREDVIKMNFIQKPNFFNVLCGRFKNPIRLSRVFIRDLGFWIYMLILVKLWIDAIITTVTYPFKSKSQKQGIEDYAKKLGLTMDDIQRLKDSQE